MQIMINDFEENDTHRLWHQIQLSPTEARRHCAQRGRLKTQEKLSNF